MATQETKIERSGNLIKVTPCHRDLLSRQLTYAKTIHSYSAGRHKASSKWVSLCWEKNGSMITPAGFTSRVCNALQKAGISYTIIDYRENILPPPDFSRMGRLRPGQDEVIAKIVSSDGGVILAPTAYGKSHIIVELCKIYPTVPIIICTSAQGGLSVIGTLYDRLTEVFPAEVGAVCSGKRGRNRITLTTATTSLLKAGIDECRLFLFDEVHSAAAEKTSKLLAKVRNARMYGFTASLLGRCDGAELRIEGIFGPIVSKIPYEKAEELGLVSPIEVRLYDVAGSPINVKSPIARTRRGIWRNAIRNEKIAEIANEFSDDTQVLISVETLGHGFRLRSLLPGYEFIYGSMNKDHVKQFMNLNLLRHGESSITDVERAELRHRFESRDLKKAIATSVWNSGVDFKQLEVLIRADGKQGAIPSTQIPGRLSRTADGKERGILIDFLDTFDFTMANRAKSRVSTYRKLGWNITYPSRNMNLRTRY